MSSGKRQAPKKGFHPRRKPLNPKSLLRQLAAEQRERAGHQQTLVDGLRANGTTWREIAEITGLNSAQAARYRFTRKGPPPTKASKPS